MEERLIPLTSFPAVPSVSGDSIRPAGASEPPLLAALVYRAPDDFFDVLVGRLQRLLHGQPASGLSSDAVGQVLRALLQHDGWHSNRVWAGVPRLSQVAGVGERTVRRVLQWLRSLGIVREVTGEELHRGPGPHHWPLEKRRGKWDTTCYDLSGLVPLIPAAFRTAPTAANRASEAGYAGDPAPEFPDPFADPLPSPSFPLSKETQQTPSCPVPRTEDEPGETEKTPSPQAQPSPFAWPDLASIRTGEASVRSARVAPGDERTAYIGLRQQKISDPVTRGMLSDRGARWCLTLLAYARWTRRRKAVGPGWLVAVWQHWQQGDEGWPDDFLTWYAREKKGQRCLLPARVAPPRLAAAPAAPSPPPRNPGSGQALLAARDALSPDELARLETRARDELRSELGHAPIPPLVRSRVLLLLSRERLK